MNKIDCVCPGCQKEYTIRVNYPWTGRAEKMPKRCGACESPCNDNQVLFDNHTFEDLADSSETPGMEMNELSNLTQDWDYTEITYAR